MIFVVDWFSIASGLKLRFSAGACAGWDKPVDELYAEVANRIPVRRLGQPVDIAHAVAFLLSDAAGYSNGTSLVLDGGALALPPW